MSSLSTITTKNNKISKPNLVLQCASYVLVLPPTLVIKLCLENHIITFATSSLEPADFASYYARRLPKDRPSYLVQIMVKLHLQAFWQNFENAKKIGPCLQN